MLYTRRVYSALLRILCYTQITIKILPQKFNEQLYIINQIKINTMTLEEIRNEISRREFDLDYDQLGPNEKEWVEDEMFNAGF